MESWGKHCGRKRLAAKAEKWYLHMPSMKGASTSFPEFAR
jgi:hypothetical protein